MSNWDLKIDWKGEGGRESSDYFFILFSDQNQLIFGGKKIFYQNPNKSKFLFN